MSNDGAGNGASTAAAEGRGAEAIASVVLANATQAGDRFVSRFLVSEVFFDPQELDDTRIKDIQARFGLVEAAFLRSMPPNTIIARIVNETASGHARHHYLFPMLPPHLMLPVQAGEHVWAFFEQNRAVDHGFWMCRISEPRHVDDVNHTHADRKFHVQERNLDAADKFERVSNLPPGFANGPTYTRNGKLEVAAASMSSADADEQAYEKLLKETDSSKVADYESVPRFRKRPGDTVMQGSNNTLLVLGTDRTGRSAEFESSPMGKRAKGKPTKDKKGLSGTIDIVAGRGRSKSTAPKEVDNTLGRKEASKRKADENVSEGDPDFGADLSRVYISMNTDADGNFAVNLSTKENPGPATVIKSDHVRLIARKSVKILVQPSFNSPESECAGVVIKGGDIIFVPSSDGYIKLGKNASKAILTQPAAVAAGGSVTAPPITSTLGSQHGLGGPNGEFSSKVLVE